MRSAISLFDQSIFYDTISADRDDWIFNTIEEESQALLFGRMCKALREELTKKDIEPPNPIIMDGRYIQHTANFSYMVNLAGDKPLANFSLTDSSGNQKRWRWQYQGEWSAYDDQEREAYNRRKIEAEQAESETEQEKAIKTANFIWGKSKPFQQNEHSYSVRKDIQSHSARLNVYNDIKTIIVPIIDSTNNIVNIQRISEQKNAAGRDKFFIKNGKTVGCFSVLNPQDNPSVILIAEGFATTASLIESAWAIEHSALGIMALNAANMPAVANIMRERYPNAVIYLCADKDANGTGIKHATRAAEAVNGMVLMPPLEQGDWNDYLTSPSAKPLGDFIHIKEKTDVISNHSVIDSVNDSHCEVYASCENVIVDTGVKKCQCCGDEFKTEYNHALCVACYSIQALNFDTLARVSANEDMPYLVKRLGISYVQLPDGLDLRHGTDKDGHFIVYPLKFKRDITGYQKIYDNGNIKNIGKTKGSYCSLNGEINLDRQTYFVTGLAVGLVFDIHKIDANVIICLNMKNLNGVYSNIDPHLISQGFVIIDNTITRNGNAGIYNAINHQYPFALYPTLGGKACDFADVYKELGEEEFKRQIISNKLRIEKGFNYYLQLIEVCDVKKVNKLIDYAAFIGSKEVITYEIYRELIAQLVHVAKERGILNAKTIVRERFKKYVKERIRKIQKDNTITDFTGIEVIETHVDDYRNPEAVAQLNESLAQKIVGVGGVWLVNTGMGSGKTLLMSAVDKAYSQRLDNITTQEIKQHYLNHYGTSDDWEMLERNPVALDNQIRKVKERLKEHTTMYICHRRSLCDDASEKLNFENYQNKKLIEQKILNEGVVEKLVVCINSLQQYHFYNDVLFIDEIRQTYQHLLNGSFGHENDISRMNVYDAFVNKIRKGKLIVGADADLNDETVAWLKSIRTDETFYLISHKPFNKGKNITQHKNQNTVLAIIKDTVAQGKNAWVCTDSKNMAKKAGFFLQSDISAMVDDIKATTDLTDADILIATSENSGDERVAAFKKNPDKESRKYRVIIHSPIISSGVSVVNDHFDAVFGLFYGVLAPNEILQTIGRVRTVKTIHIAFKIQNDHRNFKKEEDFIDYEVVKRSKYDSNNACLALTDFDKNRLADKANRNNQLINVENDFFILAQLKGYTVNNGSNVVTKIEGLNKAFKEKRINDIALAEPISDDLAKEWHEKNDLLTQAQTNSLKLHDVKELTGKDYHDVTDTDIEFYIDHKERGTVVFNHELVITNFDEVEIQKMIDDHDSNLKTRNKTTSRYEKYQLLKPIVEQLTDVDITQEMAAMVLHTLHKNYVQVELCGLGDYSVIKKDAIKQLNKFCEKIGFELMVGFRTNKTRFYRLTPNAQVKTYVVNRAKKRQVHSVFVAD